MQVKNESHQSAAQTTEQLNEGFRPRPRSEILEYEVDEDLTLYDPTSDAAHILNPTAAAIWWLCDGQRSKSDISTRLAGLYGMEESQVHQGVEETLAGFRQAGVLELP